MGYQAAILIINRIASWWPIAFPNYFNNSLSFDWQLKVYQMANYFTNNLTKQCATRLSF